MSRVGPFVRPFFQIMHRRSTSRVLRAAALGIALAFSGVFTPAQAYVLEGKSWPMGSTVLMQLNLGSAGRTLQDDVRFRYVKGFRPDGAGDAIEVPASPDPYWVAVGRR